MWPERAGEDSADSLYGVREDIATGGRESWKHREVKRMGRDAGPAGARSMDLLTQGWVSKLISVKNQRVNISGFGAT